MKYLFFILILCGACIQKNSEESLNLTEDQLKKIILNRPTMPTQNSDEILIKLEENYKIDSSNIENVYNLAFIYCTRCLQNINSDTLNCLSANRYFQRVKNLDRNFRDGKAFYNSHLCYKKIGNRDAALVDLNIFIKKNMNNRAIGVNFYLQRADLYYESGKINEACQDLKYALKLDTIGLYKLSNKILCK